MSPNHERFQPSLPHDRVEQLLPWYVNRSLAAAERDGVRAHLAQCPACREEAARLAGFAERLVRSPLPAVSSQAAFARFKATLSPRPPSWRARWRLALEPSPGFVRLAIALSVLLVALPLGFRHWQAATDPRFHTLADPAAEAASATGDLRVLFDTTLSPERIQALLRPIGGIPVGGPDPAGVYTVRLAGRAASSAEIQEAIARLRGQAGVLFVEPVYRP